MARAVAFSLALCANPDSLSKIVMSGTLMNLKRKFETEPANLEWTQSRFSPILLAVQTSVEALFVWSL